jgi:hypothetical protein
MYEKIYLTHFYEWIHQSGILSKKPTGLRKIGKSLAMNTAAAGLFVDFKSACNQLQFNAFSVHEGVP